MASRTRKKKATRLQSTQTIIEERIEFLTELKADMESGEEIPMVKLGGLLDDLMQLNPITHRTTVPFLLELFEAELATIKRIALN